MTTIITKKQSGPGLGLATVAMMWLWGAILFYAPNYVGATGVVAVVLNCLGWLLVAFSFAGAGIELGKMLKTKATEYWGIGLFFLVPAGVLHYWLSGKALAFWTVLGRSLVLFLAALGGGFLISGFPFSFHRPDEAKPAQSIDTAQLAKTDGPVPPLPSRSHSAEERAKLIGALVVVVLNIITAILKLMAERH
jgi:hypothetical protein